ncbi:ABC transporter permease [Pseudoroseicyclus sp. H15]
MKFQNVLIRLFRIVLTAWAAATFVFIVLRLAGDPVAALIPSDLPQDVIDSYRERYGLDRSLVVQYVNYLLALLQGDFGYSFRTGDPAIKLFLDRVPATLILAGASLVLAIVIGVISGVIAALYRNTFVDRFFMTLSVFGFAMPNFFFGILLILFFTLNLRLLPSSGFESWSSLIMPAVTLGFAASGSYARMTRSALLEVLSQPYIEMARAKGLAPMRVLVVHAMRAITVPLVSLLGFSIGAMLAGAVVTETVFAWPGIGRLLVVSVTERDLAVVQVVVIFSALVMAISNTLIDLALAVLDPRIGTARSNAS